MLWLDDEIYNNYEWTVSKINDKLYQLTDLTPIDFFKELCKNIKNLP